MWLVGHSVPFVRSHVLQVWLTDISYFLGGNFWAKSGIRLDGWDETCELRAGHNLHGCCVGHDGLEDARMSVERENVKCNCLVNKVAMSLSFLKYQWPFEKCLLVVSTKFSNIYWTSRGYEVIDIFRKSSSCPPTPDFYFLLKKTGDAALENITDFKKRE